MFYNISRIIIAALAIVASITLGTKANAQLPPPFPQTRGVITVSPAPDVPARFLPLLDAYRGWTPELATEEPFANSIYNWATRALNVAEGLPSKQLLISTARNYVFLRAEPSLTTLALKMKPQLKDIFGDFYLGWGLQTVASKAYSPEIHRFYEAWYACIATSKNEGGGVVGEKYVLAQINWREGSEKGLNDECLAQFTVTSQYYGVEALTVDDLTSLGALYRRERAHLNNPRFVSAEVVRQAVYKVFEED